ncbi:hypothetical protein GOODEAATRI_011228 [Goodea atripinnis]|uniref:Uncharacterized protein n=1 Tax=Goodea atripinnis TaxID=208336 RepID=A0ABV0MHZ3_9TELE
MFYVFVVSPAESILCPNIAASFLQGLSCIQVHLPSPLTSFVFPAEASPQYDASTTIFHSEDGLFRTTYSISFLLVGQKVWFNRTRAASSTFAAPKQDVLWLSYCQSSINAKCEE